MSGLRDLEQLRGKAAEKPHGTRARYVVGCRCDECRRANREYAQKREQDRRALGPNGLVPVDQVDAHLKALRRKGVGYKAVADAANVGRTALQQILNGKKTTLRARAVARILAVTADHAFDGAYVKGGQTRRLLSELVEEGFTKRRLAQLLGYASNIPQIAMRDLVTVRNAARVQRLHKRLTA